MPVPAPGALIPPLRVVVRPEPMKLYAALARDPTPIHWDEGAAGGRVINQGPLNLGYVVNLLIAWAGPEAIREIDARFTDNVLAGDEVVAGGVVTAVRDGVAVCEVWLDRVDGGRALTGTATIALATTE
jgi:acyl dehydratase